MRILAPEDFGLYGIALAVVLFYSGVGNTLFLMQMVVRFPEVNADEKCNYVSDMLVLVATFAAVSLFVDCASLLVIGVLSVISGDLLELCLAIGVACCGYLLRDFFIRYAYVRKKEQDALAINIFFSAALVIAVVVTSKLGVAYNAEVLVLIYGVCLICSSIFGLIISDLKMRSILLSRLVHNNKMCWSGGKYSLLAHIIITLRTQAHTIIVALIIGPAGVGEMNASRLFVTPATMLVPALTQVMLPRIAYARHESEQLGNRLGYRLSLMIALGAAGYSVLVLFSFEPFLVGLVGEKYGPLFGLVFAWCVYTTLSAFRTGQETTIVALKRFKRQAASNFVGAMFALIAVYSLARSNGEIGAVAGLCISEILVIWLLHRDVSETMAEKKSKPGSKK